MFCAYQNYKKSAVCIQEPYMSESKGNQYYTMNYEYMQYFDDFETLNEFTLEGCEMEIKRGITNSVKYGCRLDEDKKQFKRVSATLYPRKHEHNSFIKVVENISELTKEVIQQYSTRFFHGKFTKNNIDHCFNSMIIGTGESLQINFRLVPNVTVFTDLDGNEISQDLLEGTYMKIIPVIRFRHVNINHNMITVKMELVKAIVTYAQGEKYDQSKTMTLIKEQRPNSAQILTNNLALLAKKRAPKEHIISNETSSREHMVDVMSPCPIEDMADVSIPTQRKVSIDYSLYTPPCPTEEPPVLRLKPRPKNKDKYM